MSNYPTFGSLKAGDSIFMIVDNNIHELDIKEVDNKPILGHIDLIIDDGREMRNLLFAFDVSKDGECFTTREEAQSFLNIEPVETNLYKLYSEVYYKQRPIIGEIEKLKNQLKDLNQEYSYQQECIYNGEKYMGGFEKSYPDCGLILYIYPYQKNGKLKTRGLYVNRTWWEKIEWVGQPKKI